MTRFLRTAATLAAMLAVLLAATSARAAERKDIVDTAVAAGSFNTLAAALQAAGLVGALKGQGPFTVFAPTDEAFSKLPAGTVETLLKPENKERLTAVLTYHVVPGRVAAEQVVELSGAKTLNGQRIDVRVDNGSVGVDNANVVHADIDCSNGVIHVIDNVILPSNDNIVATADKAGTFNTLLAAAKAAGLADALTGEGPLTVFAPTDEAFAKLPDGTVKSLLRPENQAALVSILKYHVVPGRVYSEDALAAKEAATLQGGKIRVTVSGGEARVNDAKLLATDIDASNGVIHVIDEVIMPPKKGASTSQGRGSMDYVSASGLGAHTVTHSGTCGQVH